MAKRKIITIDEEKCNGCGNCVTGCHEGALQIVDGVAKLVNEHFCDGFGDCIGECPTGALKIEEKEAAEFDLEATKEHVENLRGTDAAEKMMQAQEEHAADETNNESHHNHGHAGGCPGSRMKMMNKDKETGNNKKEIKSKKVESQLEQWPVQFDLLSPQAPYFDNSDLLITADCVPVAYGDYQQMLKGKSVAMGCPKLDDAQSHTDKLAAIIKENDLNSISIVRMEVPCCGGLVRIAEQALEMAESDLELEVKTIGVDGEISI